MQKSSIIDEIDQYVSTAWLRAWGGLSLATSWIYIAFLASFANSEDLVWSWLFISMHVIFSLLAALLLVNNWLRKTTRPFLLQIPDEKWPIVAVIVPLHKEPLKYLAKTIHSILEQDYPIQSLHIVVTVDAARADVAAFVELVATDGVNIHFNRSPDHGDPAQAQYGDYKAGNLNCALEYVYNTIPQVKYIETRDVDDLVGQKLFLKACISYLLMKTDAAYVQTIKDAAVGPGDPFNNLHRGFYYHIMQSKYAVNALFPCGSGVVFRRAAIEDIDGFSCWNLVEDYSTGISLARRGWQSGYLPIVGAFAQSAPEDIPNNFKQRGTWAIDSVRYLLYGKKKGLSLRQRLQFFESGVYYSLSILYYMLIISPALALLFNVRAVNAPIPIYLCFVGAYTLSTFVFLSRVLGAKSIKSLLQYTEDYMVYLNFVFFKAALLALVYGPNNKPRYKVTRKQHQYGIYLKYVIPQIAVMCVLLVSVYYEVFQTQYWDEIDYASIAWAVLFIYLLQRSLKKAWYGVAVNPEQQKSLVLN